MKATTKLMWVQGFTLLAMVGAVFFAIMGLRLAVSEDVKDLHGVGIKAIVQSLWEGTNTNSK